MKKCVCKVEVEHAYEVIIKWRKNVFKLPPVRQTIYADSRPSPGEKGPLECIAIKAAAILTPLLLQKPAGKPTYRDNVNHLSRRLQLWDAGNFKELLREGGRFRRIRPLMIQLWPSALRRGIQQ